MYEIAQIKKDSVSLSKAADLKKLKLGEGTTWVHINAKSQKELDEVKKYFGFHKLAIEDSVDRQQRPKVEIFDDYLVIIVKDLELKANIVVNQLALFVGKNYLVSVSNKELDEIKDVQKKLEVDNSPTPDRIAYKILDRIVDSYFPILDGIEDEIEHVEKTATKPSNNKHIAEKIFSAKRKLLALRKATWPARDVFSALSKGDLQLISGKNRIYYRDVYDHVVLVIDLVETYRELLSGVLETHLSSISNSLNEVMKVLTVIATIFIPLTFVTGLYGMNFDFMPEIAWEYGYVFSLGLMAIIGGGMLMYFRKKRWV